MSESSRSPDKNYSLKAEFDAWWATQGTTSDSLRFSAWNGWLESRRRCLAAFTPSHAPRNECCGLGYVAGVSECPGCPRASAASTTPQKSGSATPRMDATLGKVADWVFAEGCKLERELAVSFKRFDDLQAHYSNELTKLEGASAASATPRITDDMVDRALEAAKGAMVDTRRFWTNEDRAAVRAMLAAAHGKA